MIDNNNKCGDTTKTPEFARIINELSNEMFKTEEFSSLIMNKTCKIRDFRDTNPSPCEEVKIAIQNDGILDELESIISRLKKNNNTMEIINTGLGKFIG